MISLKKNIEACDYRLICQTALQSFVAAIDSLAQNTIRVDQEGVKAYRTQLLSLKQRLEGMELNLADLNPADVRAVASELDNQSKGYRVQVEGILKESTHDLRDVVSVLAAATESLSQRENSHSSQLSRISGGLEAISHINDLGQVRLTLNRQVGELRACIGSMSRDTENALSGLQKEIAGFQQRLEKVQIEASTDPLTGVANRLRCSREVANRIRSQTPFGILLFDLNKFKDVNDTYGHAAGDGVLRAIARRLVAHVRANDLVCRWGGDEFVVVHDGLPGELSARAERIAQEISGKITVKVNDADHELSVGAAFGWADHRKNESQEELFSRADKLLYDTKAPALKMAAKTPNDAVTGLPQMATLHEMMAQLGGELASWSLGCFAIRSAAKVNGHYGFSATDTVLPFLCDEVRESKFGTRLFRGRGASIVALVHSPSDDEALQQDVRRICGKGLEKHLKQQGRASMLPIAVAAKTFSAEAKDLSQQIRSFVDLQGAAEAAPKFLKKVVV